MVIAVGSDMKAHVVDVVIDHIRQRGHSIALFGALQEEKPVMWSKVAIEVAQLVAEGKFDQAVLFCWTGTGISLAANKVMGVRAALCHDAQTARGARKWNDANILALSLRSLSEEVAREILDAWFETGPSEDPDDVACISYLNAAEKELVQQKSTR